MATNEDYERIRKKYPTRLTRARAIKLYCKSQCCCDDMDSWKNCTITACFLWRFRMGKEILGNQTSFKKPIGKTHRILPENTIPQTGGEQQ